MADFNVVFNGRLVSGVNRAELIEVFSTRFGYPKTRVVDMLASRKPVVLKRNVERDVAEKFQGILRDMGMEVDIEAASPGAALDLALEPMDKEKENPANRDLATMAEPVQASDEFEYSDGTASTGVFKGIAAVDAGRGLYWISQGYSGYVSRALGAWIGATVIYVILTVVLSLVPLLGSLATMLLAPVLIAGFMLGAKAQDEGGKFTLSHLFSGFSQNTGQLILVGLLYMAGVFAIGIVAVIFVGGAFLSAGALASDPQALSSLYSNPGVFLLPILFVMLLVIPLMMAYWFAPALIVLSGLPATTAMAESFRGCIKNILPFLVYGVVGALLAIIAAIPFFLGFLILAPVLTASMYVAWKDIFGQS